MFVVFGMVVGCSSKGDKKETKTSERNGRLDGWDSNEEMADLNNGLCGYLLSF
jgi:hypothetical protein